MDIRKLQKITVDALTDIKANNIEVINTSRRSTMFMRIIVASASSGRQTRALARHVAEKVRASGGQVLSIEGEDTAEWVLVDLGDIVVHIMQPVIRAYYDLESLWRTTPKARTTGGKPDNQNASAN